MSDERKKVDLSRLQRPYIRGPQARKNLEDEFAREFPGEEVAAQGEERYEAMEQRLRDLAAKRKAEKDKEL